MNKLTDTFKLYNGVRVPCVGYGTYLTPDGDIAKNSVKEALKVGYRHIDTAFIYGNEKAVGEGLRESGIDRKEIFVTTKHWVTMRGFEKASEAIDISLKNLGLDYLDLYLIHWPCVEKVSPDWKEINASTWRAFEDAYKSGKIRAIGVSNFQKKHYDALADRCEIKPMVNQIEFHPGYIQSETVAYSQKQGMLVQAFSPLGCGAVLSDKTLEAIAKKYNKSVAQLCLRFVLQSGLNVLTKSVTPSRIIENADIFDFEINAEDMAVISALPELGFTGWLPENAPADALA
ncbi:MAG: aldo/keto reductase [Clostridia bacterium]|nr:aldo/keto reductase [Clostridia bacterium]MBQ6796030.1 aldo/keto reductase [Clostridia bacterium]